MSIIFRQTCQHKYESFYVPIDIKTHFLLLQSDFLGNFKQKILYWTAYQTYFCYFFEQVQEAWNPIYELQPFLLGFDFVFTKNVLSNLWVTKYDSQYRYYAKNIYININKYTNMQIIFSHLFMYFEDLVHKYFNVVNSYFLPT